MSGVRLLWTDVGRSSSPPAFRFSFWVSRKSPDLRKHWRAFPPRHDSQTGILRSGLNSLLLQRPDSWSEGEIADRSAKTDKATNTALPTARQEETLRGPRRSRVAADVVHQISERYPVLS